MKTRRTIGCGGLPSEFRRGVRADYAADEWWWKWQDPLRLCQRLELVMMGWDHGGIGLVI